MNVGLWTSTFKPKTRSGIIGNRGTNKQTNIRTKIHTEIHRKKTKKHNKIKTNTIPIIGVIDRLYTYLIKRKKNAKDVSPCAMICGPNGVGKTIAMENCAKSAGPDVNCL